MVSILNYPNYKILSADEEFELAMCAKKGDKAARDLLILSNIAFAISYSKKFAGYHLEKDDLIQEAITGLVRAADKFIPETGNRFITYAKFWIRNEIQRAAHKASKTPASCLSDLSIDENSDAEEFISSICDNEIINVEEDYIYDETCTCVKKAVASLGEKEVDIIARHYGFDNVEPESLSEIAESYGLTKPRIHQIEQKAFYTLRNSLEDLYA